MIGNVEIQCYVLEDETRVFSQRGLLAGVGMGTGGSKKLIGAPRMVEFVGGLEGKGLNTNNLAARLNSPVQFQPPSGGRTAYGYPATLLADVCDAVLAARANGILLKQHDGVVARCELLIRGFARVGLIALVDEATGYQEVRAQRALATILEKFIAKELQPWTRTFPYEFYRQIFRLKGWPGPHGVKRPSVIGHYTNDVVYARLAPGVLDELRNKNPVQPSSGRRRSTHHQWFTPDIGNPKLKEHLAAVIALMRAAANWDSFQRMLNRAFPAKGKVIPLPLEDEPPRS